MGWGLVCVRCPYHKQKRFCSVYDKPMILYPLETLRKQRDQRKLMIVCSPDHSGHFMDFLGSGEQYGVEIGVCACRLKRTASRPLLALAEDFDDNDYLAVHIRRQYFEHDFTKDIFKCVQEECGVMVFLKKCMTHIVSSA